METPTRPSNAQGKKIGHVIRASIGELTDPILGGANGTKFVPSFSTNKQTRRSKHTNYQPSAKLLVAGRLPYVASIQIPRISSPKSTLLIFGEPTKHNLGKMKVSCYMNPMHSPGRSDTTSSLVFISKLVASRCP